MHRPQPQDSQFPHRRAIAPVLIANAEAQERREQQERRHGIRPSAPAHQSPNGEPPFMD